jgi:hypothetical protein
MEVPMKTTVALVLAVITLLPHSANAETLTITHGYVERIGEGSPFGAFGGDNFRVVGLEESISNLTPAFGVNPYIWTFTFRAPSEAWVGGQHCQAVENPSVPAVTNCGRITLTSPGFAMPTDWPQTTLFTGTVPFSATGFLLVGGNQYDMVGQGTVTGSRCLDISACGIIRYPGAPPPFDFRVDASVRYNFSVGEPRSLVLTLVSGIAIGIVIALRRSVVNT